MSLSGVSPTKPPAGPKSNSPVSVHVLYSVCVLQCVNENQLTDAQECDKESLQQHTQQQQTNRMTCRQRIFQIERQHDNHRLKDEENSEKRLPYIV